MEHLLSRRRAVARTTLVTHITAVIVLLVLMAGTEGPAAHGSGTSVTLAKLQLFLLAVAGLVQIFMAGRWTQYALLLRQARAGRPGQAAPQNPWERSAYLRARTDRGAVRVLMTMTAAAAWLAEIGCVPAAVYQAEHGGYGDPNLDFTIGMIVLFAAVTATAAMTAGFARLGAWSRTQTAPAGRPRGPEAAARLRVRLFAGLATLIALGFLGTAAAGRLGATVGFTAIGLFFASLCVAAHWQRVLDSARQHDQDLLSRRARAR
jgi:hypothetical protein